MAAEGGDTEIALEEAAAGLLLLAVLALASVCCLWCCCCRQRCRRAEEQPAKAPRGGTVLVDGQEVRKGHLLRRKELGTAYILWLGAGVVGAHHFYLDRMVHGVLCVCSANFLAVGWILDGVLLPVYLRGHNQRTAPVALSDGTCWRLSCRFIPTGLVAIAVLLLILAQGPRTLDRLGLVELDRRGAEMGRDPYDVLGIPRRSSKDVAAAALREQVQRLRAAPSCDAKCKAKFAELQQAHDYISGKVWRELREQQEEDAENARERRDRQRRDGRAREAAERSDAWDDWADFKSTEWRVLVDAARESLTGTAPESRVRRRKQSQAPSPSPPGPRGRGRRRGGSRGQRGDL